MFEKLRRSYNWEAPFKYGMLQIWCDFDRASLLIWGNKMPTRYNRGFYCRSYCLLNIFRAPLCLSSGAQEYYTVVAACGISCCVFQVAGLVRSWVLTQAVYLQVTRNSYREWQYHMLHVYNCILLKMSTWGSKHVEENSNLWINNDQCIKMVINIDSSSLLFWKLSPSTKRMEYLDCLKTTQGLCSMECVSLC